MIAWERHLRILLTTDLALKDKELPSVQLVVHMPRGKVWLLKLGLRGQKFLHSFPPNLCMEHTMGNGLKEGLQLWSKPAAVSGWFLPATFTCSGSHVCPNVRHWRCVFIRIVMNTYWNRQKVCETLKDIESTVSLAKRYGTSHFRTNRQSIDFETAKASKLWHQGAASLLLYAGHQQPRLRDLEQLGKKTETTWLVRRSEAFWHKNW